MVHQSIVLKLDQDIIMEDLGVEEDKMVMVQLVEVEMYLQQVHHKEILHFFV
jgi:hypothetical protein